MSSAWGTSWGISWGVSWGSDTPVPPTPSVTSTGGVKKKKVIRLSELADGDRRNTADFLKAHIAKTPEREPFTQAPMTKAMPMAKADVMTNEQKNDIIAIILMSL